MKLRALAPLAALLVAACGPSGTEPLPVASSGPGAVSAAPSASIASSSAASPSVALPSEALPSAASSSAPPRPRALSRSVSPGDLRAADEKGCADGEADACRRMADRHRGYGLVAGCGVDRGRAKPFIKRLSEDSDVDAERFEHFIRRACELGDAEACSIARTAPSTYSMPTDVARRRAARSRPEEVGVLRYRLEKTPENKKILENLRNTCITTGASCWDADLLVFKRDPKKPEGKVLAEEIARVERLCGETHDCAEMMMMLDKSGVSPDELAPARASFADTLTKACVAGECTCGEAGRYLPATDPTSLDLAILGCDDGEAEGCYELGRHFEDGVGVDKDVDRARALYELACPPARPLELGAGPRLGEYSPRACDRLAEIVGGGAYPPTPFARAMYYAQFACIHPGYEIDQAPCVRLGRYWASNPIATGHAISDARDAAEGPLRAEASQSECNRPSVKDACDAFQKAMLTVR